MQSHGKDTVLGLLFTCHIKGRGCCHPDNRTTRTLYRLGHYQLGHDDRPTRTLYQLGPHDYITNWDLADTCDRLYVGRHLHEVKHRYYRSFHQYMGHAITLLSCYSAVDVIVFYRWSYIHC